MIRQERFSIFHRAWVVHSGRADPGRGLVPPFVGLFRMLKSEVILMGQNLAGAFDFLFLGRPDDENFPFGHTILHYPLMSQLDMDVKPILEVIEINIPKASAWTNSDLEIRPGRAQDDDDPARFLLHINDRGPSQVQRGGDPSTHDIDIAPGTKICPYALFVHASAALNTACYEYRISYKDTIRRGAYAEISQRVLELRNLYNGTPADVQPDKLTAKATLEGWLPDGRYVCFDNGVWYENGPDAERTRCLV